MRTVLGVVFIFLFVVYGQAFAAPTAKILIDSTPDQAVLIPLDQWFAEHLIKEGQASRGDKIYESPRCTVTVLTSKDPLPVIGRHIHLTTDEVVFVYKGEGEMYINGQWVPVKAGTLHVCPRGVAHATRALPGKELWLISIFSPPQPRGSSDRVMLDE
jgi:mannose-6-phosphate isomerase-like protein (cupin superfamily)